MSTQTDRSKEVFLDALEIGSTAERHAYLERACGADAALRREVVELLAYHARIGSFLDAVSPGQAETVDQQGVLGAGTVIGPYRLLELIGEGGFGVVFMAEQTEPVRRKVALKVLKPGMDTRQVVARFEAERQALALMDHPNIARVLDAGAAETGRPYFVMELVRGIPITQFCDDKRLATRERLELFISVCRAVQHAHQKGIIHRDLKPTNVLVTLHDGTPVVKVIDFGIAKALGQQLTEKTLFTGFAQLVGTPLYMSPEQAELSGLDVDTRSDIYSLGVLLYELLTGTTPLSKERLSKVGYDELRRLIREEEPPKPSTRLSESGDSMALISSQRHTEPAKLTKLVRGELDWIVMKALEKDRNRRYETAGAFAADVQRYLDDEAVHACPPSTWYRLRKFARRNKTGALTAASVALGLVLAVGGLATAVMVQAASTAEVKAERNQTRDALDREKQVNDDLVKSLEREVRAKYRQDVQLADRELAAENVGRAEELLDGCPTALRGWEWHYLKRRHYREPLTFSGHKDWISGVAFSPDGTRAVSGSAISAILGEVKIWETASGKTIRTLPPQLGPVSGVAWSGDGKSIASAGWDGTARLWDTSTWEIRHNLQGHKGYVSCVAISPDSKLVASGGGDRTVKLWNATTGQELRTLRGHTGGLFAVAFSPDGRMVASASQDETIRIWDVASGNELHTLRGHAGGVLGVAYSRDGRRIASSGFDGNVRIWDSAAGVPLITIRADVVFARSVAFNRDGTRLAVGSWDKTVKLFDPETGNEVLTLRGGHTDMITCVEFSRNGRLLASASLDKTVRIWDATPSSGSDGGEDLVLRGDGDTLFAIVYSPDGRFLATTGFDGVVTLRDSLSGKELHSLRGDCGPLFSLSFSNNSRRLVSAGIRGVVKVWDVTTGKELATFLGNLGSAAISPDGRHVAWSREGGLVEIRDVETGRQVAEFSTHPAPVIWTAFSPDGTKLVTTSWDKTAKVWDATTRAELLTLSGHTHVIHFAAFSPDGKRLATASWDRTAKLWDAATGKELFTLRGHAERVCGASFSPDGKYLATGSYDNTVKVWDGGTGRELRTIGGHAGFVGGMVFSPDGKRLAIASGYRGRWEIRIWDVTQWDKAPDRGPEK